MGEKKKIRVNTETTQDVCPTQKGKTSFESFPIGLVDGSEGKDSGCQSGSQSWTLDPAWWNEKTDSGGLPSALHMHKFMFLKFCFYCRRKNFPSQQDDSAGKGCFSKPEYWVPRTHVVEEQNDCHKLSPDLHTNTQTIFWGNSHDIFP